MKNKINKRRTSAFDAGTAGAANADKHVSSKNQILSSSTYPTMTDKFVAPPPHVWARIEKILDEQDKAKTFIPPAKAVTYSLGEPPQKKKLRAVYTVLGATFAVCFFKFLF